MIDGFLKYWLILCLDLIFIKYFRDEVKDKLNGILFKLINVDKFVSLSRILFNLFLILFLKYLVGIKFECKVN